MAGWHVRCKHFNPRRPRGRRRVTCGAAPLAFQPTPPARAATSSYVSARTYAWRGHISTHAARAGGDLLHLATRQRATISTHAARAGGDSSVKRDGRSPQRFQPTPPARAATAARSASPRVDVTISTHAARAGGDGVRELVHDRHAYFNPRRPRGRRPDDRGRPGTVAISTHAARAGGDVPQACRSRPRPPISTHAARAGGDLRQCDASREYDHFNPRRPRGRRRGIAVDRYGAAHFNPRRPRGRRQPALNQLSGLPSKDSFRESRVPSSSTWPTEPRLGQ